ncbi:MAG: M28 family metallopeptidase [Planctomycetota bacterium]
MTRHPPLRRVLSAASALPLFLVGLAHASAPAASAAIATSRLEMALDTIQTEKIRSDVFFIASDELGGRDTPSPGQRIAARYIRARLERLGWQPGARDGYFFGYPDGRERIDETATKLVWERGTAQGELRFAEDYFLRSTSDCKPLQVSGPVVFCGEGGKADLGQLGVTGKWALCWDDGTDANKLRGRARQAGAIGLLLAPGPAYSGEPYARRFAKAVENQRRGIYRSGRRSRDEDEEKDGPYPLLLLEKGAVESLAAAAGTALGTLAPGTDLGLTLSDTRKMAGSPELENVCGFWPGSDPALGRETIVISAHYDHIGVHNGLINNGADDNGSGTSGLLAIAESLASYGPMKRSVLLLWVSGEEKGLWGSEAWTKDPWLPNEAKAICNINIDMIGRNAPDKLLITPTSARPEYNGLVKIAEKVAPLEGFPSLGSCDEYWSRSDHKNFAENLKIPVAFLFSDVHEDYHKPTDDPEKVDMDKVRRVSRMVVRMLEELQAEDLAF